MNDAPAIDIKEMPFAVPNDDRTAVVFRFNCHDGSEHTFACPPRAVPIITARLLGAAQRLATDQNLPILGIAVTKSQIVLNEENRTVGLLLFPEPETGVPFVLSPQHAQKILSDLAQAAAKIAPPDPQSTH